ncbi:hypothetical protein TRAPUB_646 [Trametes pubescens]|uniref:Uncharacterized protein n=1 Tax=Trametes pubescens TaxID=154538 RepID=A0A1M2VLN2_TRAPU|nr:hypothetical protein TRAPUB_646 [Trametes pubescens]
MEMARLSTARGARRNQRGSQPGESDVANPANGCASDNEAFRRMLGSIAWDHPVASGSALVRRHNEASKRGTKLRVTEARGGPYLTAMRQ